MPAKLQPQDRPAMVRSEFPWKVGGVTLPLFYANLDFSSSRVSSRLRVLLRLIDPEGSIGWSERRTIAYLKEQQPAFRRALEWVASGAVISFDESNEDGEVSFSYAELQKKWDRNEAVQFLQQHALGHGGLTLRWLNVDKDSCSGLELVRKWNVDPLDTICWYTLSSLMWNVMPVIRRCKYEKCGRFFQLRTARKLYCRDRCRAGDYMSQKTPKQKRKYMREWRAIKHRLSARKQRSVHT